MISHRQYFVWPNHHGITLWSVIKRLVRIKAHHIARVFTYEETDGL